MLALFLSLTAFNLLCLALCAALGYAVGGTASGQWHQLAGVASIMICCAVHCVVFTYFIATARSSGVVIFRFRSSPSTSHTSWPASSRS